MKTLLILGAGSGGTMMANKMVKQLDPAEWKVIVVDRDERHFYQPGFLFIPFQYLYAGGCGQTQARFLGARRGGDPVGHRTH